MSDSNQQENTVEKGSSTFRRVARYTVVKLVTIMISVVIGLYLTILVANLGGYVDEVFRGMINEMIFGMVRAGQFKDIDEADREQAIADTLWMMEESYGLHEPFLLRTLSWLKHGLILDLGEARYRYPSDPDTGQVKELVLESLPYTLFLVGGSNLIIFFVSVLVALNISRKYGSFIDRVMISLSPISAAPSWVIGIVLILVFATGLRILPYPRAVNIFGVENWVDYLPYLARYLVLPFMAIFLGAFFQSVYVWRTYFLIYSSEDYVEMAQAKGLPSYQVERKYILRPTLPYLITSFALTMIGLWQGAIALEILFQWQGIGALFIQAIRRFDTALVVGVVVVFAYMLALTVFILDIAYALLDPRVKIDTGNQRLQQSTKRKWWQLRSGKAGKSKALPPHKPDFGHVTKTEQLTEIPIETTIGKRSLAERFSQYSPILSEIARMPSALIGLAIILVLVLISIYTILAVPYREAVSLWRREENAFYQNPRTVPPAWTNFFRRKKLPTTIIFNTAEDDSFKTVEKTSDRTKVTITFPFEYDFDEFPQDLIVFFRPEYAEKLPLVNMTWTRPDDKEINLGQFSITGNEQAFYLSQDEKLKRRLGESPLEEALFADPDSGVTSPMPGQYQMKIVAFLFEDDADIDVEMVLYGQVHGLAGTDNKRRDLSIALLWGTPVALAFGIIGALLTSLISMLIAAFGVWYGGWIDNLVQRITEINLILPSLAIAIMVYLLYSKSIWAILGVVVLLNIFGSSVKVFRAAFLQMREAPYLEAAQAYGASRPRIIFHYLVPRITPVLIPQLVIMVPGYVFYEATLAYLGLSDPYLPTWGKVIYEAFTIGAFNGAYYWLIEPLTLLMLTGIAFAMFGFALDRILNPRLRAE